MSQDQKIDNGLPIQTLLQLIPDFDTNNQSQVYRYIRSCDSAFELASITQHKILLVYALNKISGPFASDVHIKIYNTWSELKTFLIQKFSQVKTLAHLNLELQSMFQKPSESVTDYFHRVDTCRNKILEKIKTEITDNSLLGRIETTEETALSVFTNGLNSDIGTMLRTQGFTNLCDAGYSAMQEDKIRLMNSARQRLFRPSPSNTHTPHSSVATSRNYARPSVFSPNRNNANTKICNYCKNLGHTTPECRKRAFNNGLRQGEAPNIKTSPTPLAPRNGFTPNQRITRPSNINNLNSQAAEPLDTSETASALYSNVQTPTSTQNLLDLETNDLQFR